MRCGTTFAVWVTFNQQNVFSNRKCNGIFYFQRHDHGQANEWVIYCVQQCATLPHDSQMRLVFVATVTTGRQKCRAFNCHDVLDSVFCPIFCCQHSRHPGRPRSCCQQRHFVINAEISVQAQRLNGENKNHPVQFLFHFRPSDSLSALLRCGADIICALLDILLWVWRVANGGDFHLKIRSQCSIALKQQRRFCQS